MASPQIQRDLVVRQQNSAVWLPHGVIGIAAESIEIAGYDVVAYRQVAAVGPDVPAAACDEGHGVVTGKRVEAVGIPVPVQVDGRFRVEARECERIAGDDVTVARCDGEVGERQGRPLRGAASLLDERIFGRGKVGPLPEHCGIAGDEILQAGDVQTIAEEPGIVVVVIAGKVGSG